HDYSLSSVQLAEPPDTPHRPNPHLKVEFSTKADLPQIVADGYPLQSWAYFCDRPDDYVFLSDLELYFHDQRVTGETEIVSTHGPVVYSTYLHIARQAVSPSVPAQLGYDMRQNTEDVCFYVRGGNPPLGYKSNIVRIPKGMIEEALKA